MLCDLLNSHPDIACEHELFRDHEKRSNHREAMDDLARRANKPIAVGHAHFGQLHSDMLQDGIKRLLLVRTGKLGAISTLLMGLPRAQGFRVDPAHIAHLEDERKLHTTLMRPYADWIVTYEELTANQDIETLSEENNERFCKFFGVNNYPLKTSVRKNPTMLPSNYEELRA